MRAIRIGTVMCFLACLVVPLAAQRARGEARRVILFLGDGVGAAYWTAARFAAGQLAVEQFPVVGLVDVRSASDTVTDSAAGATVFATGVRTYNGAVGVGPDSMPLRTVLEEAQALGLGTGLVATSSITHATPAAFVAHVPNRNMHAEIARQMAAKRIDVLLGGGRGFFDGSLRRDRENLLPGLMRHYTYVDTETAFRALRADTVRALMGLFAADAMPRAGQRHPTLAEMTRVALQVLDRNAKGFFLMVEGSQPDWRGHANEPLPALASEVLDFDQAIGVALQYRRRQPETLVVVVADHETGGLALQEDSAGAIVARYTTPGHTATMVPLFAIGPGADAFGGIKDNDRIGRELLAVVRGERRAAR